MPYLNMSDLSHSCPSNWNLVVIASGKRGCDRASGGCNSDFFSYSLVCGRVNAYQKGTPGTFNCGWDRPGSVSLTHESAGSCQHIWTFVEALYEMINSQYVVCECWSILSFPGPSKCLLLLVTTTSVTPEPDYDSGMLYEDDPLWDGQGCGTNSACCQFNSPPCFCTTLPQSTTNNLELRICLNQGMSDEDAVIHLVDVYVK